MNNTEAEISELLKAKATVRLDIGCGDHKQLGWVGMDKRECEGVDIVHNIEDFPWPLPDNCCVQVLMSHVWEHIEPKHRLDMMNELWRILLPGGQLLLSAPYANSPGAMQDPSHYKCPNKDTFVYFDPAAGVQGVLYNVYKPKPWKLIQNNYQLAGNIEVIMEPRK